jgi:hypothetical protein
VLTAPGSAVVILMCFMHVNLNKTFFQVL